MSFRKFWKRTGKGDECSRGNRKMPERPPRVGLVDIPIAHRINVE